MNNIKKRFPIFKNNPDLIYLDSASTSLKPQIVLDKMNEYYTEYGVNINRGLYDISYKATQEYELVRKKIAKFINADADEIIFTSGTTLSLNMLAHSLGKELMHNHNVLLTEYEHHANLVPWQIVAKQYGFKLGFIPLNIEEYKLELGDYIDENTKIISFSHVSNSLGLITDAKDLVKKAKDVGAITIIDAAQSIAHMPIDVRELDCDFLVFSGHKLFGPTGTGVLYGKRDRLKKLQPSIFGGDMVLDVDYGRAEWNGVPHRFEAGTPNIAGVLGLGTAIDFISDVEFSDVVKYKIKLTDYLIEELSSIERLKIICSDRSLNRAPIVSFVIDGIHPHDIAEILNRYNVAIRAGHHCTMPIMKKLGISGTARVSFGIYNTKDDIDICVVGIREVIRLFS